MRDIGSTSRHAAAGEQWRCPRSLRSDHAGSDDEGWASDREEPTSFEPWGSGGSPTRLRRRCGHPAAQRFFYTRPGSPLPAIDCLVVPLQRTTLRLLVAPAELMHQPTDMIAVVADPELAPNQARDAIASPQVCGMAVGDRSLQQQPQEALLLSGTQSGGSSGRRPNIEDLLPNSVSRVAPSHDRARLAVDPARNFVERQAFIEQCQRSSAARGQNFRGSLGSHGVPPKDQVLHSLRRYQ